MSGETTIHPLSYVGVTPAGTVDPAAKARSIIADQVADKIMHRIYVTEDQSVVSIIRAEVDALLVRLNYTGVAP